MCTWKRSPLCRFTPPPRVTAGFVGDAPLTYSPVELLPSGALEQIELYGDVLGIPLAPPGRPPPYPEAAARWTEGCSSRVLNGESHAVGPLRSARTSGVLMLRATGIT